MKLKNIISKSKNNMQMEVIAIDKNGCCHTLHCHLHNSEWKYCAGYDPFKKIILKTLDR